MNLVGRWIALLLVFFACAGQIDRQRPQWEQLMDEARHHAATGKESVLVLRPLKAEASNSAGVYVFYNNPSPFCYTYMIPGDWVKAREPHAYRSKDGKAFAGLLFLLPKEFKGFEGDTLVERAQTFIAWQHEKSLGQSLSDVELVRFDSTRPGTWKWKAAPVMHGDRLIEFPTRVFVDLSPDAVVQITVSGTSDDDGLVRRIIETLRTTSAPECYWPLLERLFKIMTSNR
jgi:hypothetical protein